MSADRFVHYGTHYGLVTRKSAGVYGEVELYDIGEDTLVGARYSDNSRQAHPYSWHPGIARLLATHVREKPRLKKSGDKPQLKHVHAPYQPPTRPKLAKHPGGDLGMIADAMLAPVRQRRKERDAVEVVHRIARAIDQIHPLDNVAEAELVAARPHIKKKRHG